jgi:hypothetical protein
MDYTPLNYLEPKSSWQISNFRSWEELDAVWEETIAEFQLYVHTTYICFYTGVITSNPTIVLVYEGHNNQHGIYGIDPQKGINSFEQIDWERVFKMSEQLKPLEHFKIETSFGLFNVISKLRSEA